MVMLEGRKVIMGPDAPGREFTSWTAQELPTKGAVISPCGLYRYQLWRTWGRADHLLTFIMLNPSTADADQDDPTIRRCIGFAKRDGFGGIRVLNLYALRSTDPKALPRHANPKGPANDEHLIWAFTGARLLHLPVIAAWGADKLAQPRGRTVATLAARHSVALQCLGKTKDGCPKHPLYLPGDALMAPLGASTS